MKATMQAIVKTHAGPGAQIREVPEPVIARPDQINVRVHATLSGEVIGRTVAVLGGGPIGIFAVAVAKAAGASVVYATDTRPYRLDLAKTLGADMTVNVLEADAEAVILEQTHQLGVDIV